MTPLLERTVVGIDDQSVTVDARGGSERIPARTVIWAAGVTASGMAASLGELTGAELDRAGRVAVEPDLTLPGAPRGAGAGRHGPRARPRMARPSSTRESLRWRCSRAATRPSSCAPACAGRSIGPFRYRDKGNLATIGRARAVADLHVIRLSGFPAWMALAPGPSLVPDRLPEPPAGLHPLVVQLLHPRPRARIIEFTSPTAPQTSGLRRRQASSSVLNTESARRSSGPTEPQEAPAPSSGARRHRASSPTWSVRALVEAQVVQVKPDESMNGRSQIHSDRAPSRIAASAAFSTCSTVAMSSSPSIESGTPRSRRSPRC